MYKQYSTELVALYLFNITSWDGPQFYVVIQATEKV
jgi:hypothetical protein